MSPNAMTGAAMSGTRELTGRHVAWALLAFFGVIFAVNGYFLYAALSTHTGTVANEPYRKGLHYNERIAADEVQQGRGWAIGLALAPARDAVTLELKQPDGAPVTGLDVTAVVSRPTTSGFDQKLALKEIAPGRYSAPLARLADGTWLVAVEGKLPAPGDVPFRMKKRLLLTQ